MAQHKTFQLSMKCGINFFGHSLIISFCIWKFLFTFQPDTKNISVILLWLGKIVRKIHDLLTLGHWLISLEVLRIEKLFGQCYGFSRESYKSTIESLEQDVRRLRSELNSEKEMRSALLCIFCICYRAVCTTSWYAVYTRAAWNEGVTDDLIPDLES